MISDDRLHVRDQSTVPCRRWVSPSHSSGIYKADKNVNDIDNITTDNQCVKAALERVLQHANKLCCAVLITVVGRKLYLSWRRLSGYLDPGGNKGFSSGAVALVEGGLVLFEELPAFPDLTMPLLGGMRDAVRELEASDRRP